MLKLNSEDFNNVEIFNYGISDEKEEKNISMIKENYGGSSAVKDFEKNYSVERIKLKNLNKENILKEKIGLVKIDVEGMEYKVLHGISDIIKRDSPIILMDLPISENIVFEEIVDGNSQPIRLLKSFGYLNFYTTKKIKKNKLIEFFFEKFLDEKFEVVKLTKIKKNEYTGTIIVSVK